MLEFGKESVQINARDFIRKNDAALALDIPQAAKQVAEWREKAELLDWLDVNRPSLAYGAEQQGQPEAWGIYLTNKQNKVECWEATHLADAIRTAKESSDE